MSESNGPQLDAACRIFTVSTSLAGANTFINRLKALSTQGQSSPSNSDANNDSDSDLTSDETVVPWTIVNRYYTADVHFSVHVIHGIYPTMFDKPHTPPAVIYVWVDGEPYAKHVEELSRMMGGYEPEVSLAVRIPKSGETAGLVEDHSETQEDNNMDIDTILMSYGFEYIDATGQIPMRRTGEGGNELPSTDEIPHLPRVLDALSTIMWPSMKSVHKGSASGGLYSKSKREHDSILEELLAHDPGTLSSPVSHRDSEDEDDLMDQMQELLHGVAKGGSHPLNFGKSRNLTSTEGSFTTNTELPPWLAPSGKVEGSDNISLSPTDIEATSPFGAEAAKITGKFSMGFEDNFTVFVSAPAVEGETTPDAMSYNKLQEIFESPMPSALASSTLEPGSADGRYRRIGSVSDFGGSDFGDEEPMYKSLDDGDDELDHDDDDLPTREEIREASAKIFGTAPSSKINSGGAHEDLDGHFDLSQVMSVLQQFKTDISGMDNEEERRKAAAKVALGLVYGLE